MKRLPDLSRHSIAVLQALLVVFLWATSYVLIKIGLDELPPITFAGLRYGLAFLALGLLSTRQAARSAVCSLKPIEWGRLLVLGLLLYSATQGAQYLALARLPAITVNLLWSFSSIMVAISGLVLLKERPTVLQWIGILVALLGALTYFGPSELVGAARLGVLIALGGVAANTAASLLGRSVNRTASISPMLVTMVSMGIGSVVLLGVGLASEGMPTISVRSWAIILWLALVNTAFAFSLWNLTLQTLSAFESSVINGTMMIWIPILAVSVLGETILPVELVGLILAAFGALLVQLRGRRPAAPGTRR